MSEKQPIEYQFCPIFRDKCKGPKCAWFIGMQCAIKILATNFKVTNE